MKIKILSLAFMLASACAFSQGVSVILSNAQMSGIAANGLPLATNTPTAGQILKAADTSGLTNYWADAAGASGGRLGTFGYNVLNAAVTTGQALVMPSSGSINSGGFTAANEVPRRTILDTDCTISNVQFITYDIAGNHAWLTTSNWGCMLLTNGNPTLFKIQFLGDSTTTFTNSGTQAFRALRGTAIDWAVTNMATAGNANASFGFTTPLYQ